MIALKVFGAWLLLGLLWHLAVTPLFIRRRPGDEWFAAGMSVGAFFALAVAVAELLH